MTNIWPDGIQECADDFGYDSVEDMLDKAVIDSVVPAWCSECNATTEMEPDQDKGYCPGCGKNTSKSVLVLLDII